MHIDQKTVAMFYRFRQIHFQLKHENASHTLKYSIAAKNQTIIELKMFVYQ